MSGGGARGIAHIGVLRVLERLRVPVDCIAGTSMGAVVGSLYAAGLGVDELQRHLGGLDWAELRTQGENRLALSPRRREEQYDLNFPFDMTVSGGRVGLPSRILAADQFESLLALWAGDASGAPTFASLPIPFKAVVTQLGNGQIRLLDRGSLARAARASMSVPGLFSPAKIDGLAYLDGGLVQNLPVETARAMGGDVVIAVNVGTPLADEQDITSFLDVSMQMMQILMEGNVREQIERHLREGDLLITPDLKGVAFMDFLKSGAIGDLGEAAAMAQAALLQGLSLSDADYRAHLAQRRSRLAALAPPPQPANPVGLIARLQAQAEGLTGTMAAAAPADVAGREAADTAGESRAGVQYLKFGAALGTDFTRSYVRINAGHRMRLGDSGIEWRNLVEIGRVQRWGSDLLVPLNKDGVFFVSPSLEVQRRVYPFFEDSIRLLDLIKNDALLGLELGATARDWGEFRLGPVLSKETLAAPEGGFFNPDNASFERLGSQRSSAVSLRARWSRDTLDDALLPRRGQRSSAEIARGNLLNDRDQAFSYGSAEWLGATSLGKSTLEAYANLGAYSSVSTHFPRLFSLGGFQRLSGYANDQFLGSRFSLLRGVVRQELTTVSALGYKLYGGVSLEMGRINQLALLGGDDNIRRLRSASVFLAAETPIGPLYLALSKPGQGSPRFYLFLGRP